MKTQGMFRVYLPFNLAFGIGPMTREPVRWWEWDKYVYALRYERDGHKLWQVRVLWFYLGNRPR